MNITDTANEIGDQGAVAELIDEKAGKPEKPNFVFENQKSEEAYRFF